MTCNHKCGIVEWPLSRHSVECTNRISQNQCEIDKPLLYRSNGTDQTQHPAPIQKWYVHGLSLGQSYMTANGRGNVTIGPKQRSRSLEVPRFEVEDR